MTMRTKKNLPLLLLGVFLMGGSLIFLSGCGGSDDPLKTGTLSARRATQWAELIGGPDAYGVPGDFLLENDQIRLVVQDSSPGREIGRASCRERVFITV